MQRLQQRLAVVRGRQQRQWMGDCLSWGLVAGGGIAACVAGIARLSGVPVSAAWIAAPLVIGPLAGLLAALVFRRSEREAAIATYRHYDLKDRISTAWAFLRGDLTLWQSLQVSDAELHLDAVDPVLVAPYDSPRPLPYGVMLAVGLGFLSNAAPEAAASLVPNEVVRAQAARVDDELFELEQFNKENPNPDIEQLIELARKIDELRQPGLEPKEALAKLSEMEVSLQAQQEQLANPQMNATPQATGETLALAEAMQAAGQVPVSPAAICERASCSCRCLPSPAPDGEVDLREARTAREERIKPRSS